MADLYKIMVHNPADIGFEDDSFAEGWTQTQVDINKDGDIVTLTVQAGYTDGYIEKAGLNIDASTYPYLVVCLKGDGDYRVAVYDGAWKDVQGWASSPTDYEVKIYDLSSVTTGTITAVRLYSGQAEGKKAHYDFVAFTKRPPQFLEDVMEVRVHQRESDLDTFEVLVDSKGPVGDDTVLLMHFDEGLGNKAFDESEYNNHGTLNGPSWIDGRFNKALSFDGDDYVEVPNSESLNPTSAITVEAWIKPVDWNGNRRVLQKGLSDNQYRLLAEGGVLKFHLAGVTNGELTCSLPSTGEWHHVVGVYDGSKMQIWIDGVKAAERTDASGSISTTTDPLYIGTKTPTSPSGDFFYGTIDEVRIHSRALSADEVEQSYRRGLPHRVLVHGRHVRIWLNSVKVFAGIIEEATPEEGGILHASGRCFGQKLLLRTKSISWSGREVSQAVKDLQTCRR